MNELDLKAYKVTMFLNSIMVFFLPFILVIHTCIQHFNQESFQLYTPEPPVGTKLIFGSFPLFSLFKLGKLAGGGIRRMLATLPKLCNPC